MNKLRKSLNRKEKECKELREIIKAIQVLNNSEIAFYLIRNGINNLCIEALIK